MSASREKKRRQDSLAGSTPKSARERDEQAAVKRANTMYTILAIAFIVLAVFLVVYNSGIIERNKTAATVDGEKYTVAQAAYYYNQSYQNFLNSDTGYMMQMYGMLDTQTSLKEQSYDDTRSWDDYFKEQAVENMKFVTAAKKLAQEQNITLDQDDQATLKDNLAALKSSASQAGYTYKAYLAAIYGQSVTPSIYEACEKDRLLASKVSLAKQESFTFSDDEIQAYYEENRDDYDLVDGAYVSVSGVAKTETDDDGNTIEATDEEKAAAMEEARKTADEILDAYQSGGSLETLAEEYDIASYYESDEMGSYGTTGEWFFDSARKSGDADVLEDESSSMYYVVLFNSRERNEALNYNIRHILVTEDNLDLPEGEEAAEGQVEAKAQEIFDSWDGTQEGFASLAAQYSQDGSSKDNGGLYENVTEGSMVAAFNDWCYEPGRKAGDSGIVTSTYGQHIMYFEGYTDTEYWHYACEEALRSEAYSDWYDATADSVSAEIDESGMSSVGR